MADVFDIVVFLCHAFYATPRAITNQLIKLVLDPFEDMNHFDGLATRPNGLPDPGSHRIEVRRIPYAKPWEDEFY